MSTRLKDIDEDVLDRRWPRYEAAALGFRHYWYPAIESRKLKTRPIPVMLLGEKIVLARGKDRVHALKDRCPHRGVPLSAGECAKRLLDWEPRRSWRRPD